ncbi:MAG: sugar transferase [Sphingorhabdus sp.]
MIQILFRLLALIALIAMLPVLLLIALILLIVQGRPVIFRQQRSGLHRQPFWLVKFRSMHNWRDSDGQLLPDAERTTKIGTFIRFTRLDEVPGLWNIVKGNMSLVGPRPLLPHTIDALGPLGEKRASVRPGITGWAQINGNTLLSLEQKVALDIWYIENRNWRLDLWILFKTLLVASGGERINNLAVQEANLKTDDPAN